MTQGQCLGSVFISAAWPPWAVSQPQLSRPFVVLVQSLSRVPLFETSWTAAARLPAHCLLELAQTHVHRVSDAIQPSHPHPPLLLPSAFLSIRVFSNELSLCIRWPNYWKFSYSISPSNEYSGLISFRTDWFDLPAVQRTLHSLLQHHS